MKPVKITDEGYEILKHLSAKTGLPISKVLIAITRQVWQEFEADPEGVSVKLFKALIPASKNAEPRDRSVKEEVVPEEKEIENPGKAENSVSAERMGEDTVVSMEEEQSHDKQRKGEERGEKLDPDEIYNMFLKRFRGGS